MSVGQLLGQAGRRRLITLGVASFQPADGFLHSLQQPPKPLGVQGAVLGGVARDSRPVHRLQHQVHQPRLYRRLYRPPEQPPHLLPVFAVKPPQGVVVGTLIPAQPHVGQLLPAGRLQLAGGAHSGHEAVEPDPKEHPGVVGRRPTLLSLWADPQLLPAGPIDAVDEDGNETGPMILGQHIIQSWRQQPSLFPAELSKRHHSLPAPAYLAPTNNLLLITPHVSAAKPHAFIISAAKGIMRQAPRGEG